MLIFQAWWSQEWPLESSLTCVFYLDGKGPTLCFSGAALISSLNENKIKHHLVLSCKTIKKGEELISQMLNLSS